MSTTPAPRAATTGLVGGALFALFPLAWKTADGTAVEFGSLSFVAVMATYWIFGVVAPFLIVGGLAGLRRTLGPDAGKVGTVGLVGSMIGLSGMALGLGIELASISVGGGEVAAGHFLLLIGFLVHIVGSILLGAVLIRRNRNALSRTAGALLTLALPLGIGLGLLGSSVDPGDDTWFWAALSVPTGIAWVLLGTSLRSVRRPAPAEFASAS